MRVLRHKKVFKTLAFYSTYFGYKKPYQVLVDGTFCQAVLQNKIRLKDQLQDYLQSELKVLTTQCIVLEVENLGKKLIDAAVLVKDFSIHRCGHEGKPIAGSSCTLQMVDKGNYIVATQDRRLQEVFRQIPGQPLLYVTRSAIVLDPLSELTKITAREKSKKSLKENHSVRAARFFHKVNFDKYKEKTNAKIKKQAN